MFGETRSSLYRFSIFPELSLTRCTTLIDPYRRDRGEAQIRPDQTMTTPYDVLDVISTSFAELMSEQTGLPYILRWAVHLRMDESVLPPDLALAFEEFFRSVYFVTASPFDALGHMMPVLESRLNELRVKGNMFMKYDTLSACVFLLGTMARVVHAPKDRVLSLATLLEEFLEVRLEQQQANGSNSLETIANILRVRAFRAHIVVVSGCQHMVDSTGWSRRQKVDDMRGALCLIDDKTRELGVAFLPEDVERDVRDRIASIERLLDTGEVVDTEDAMLIYLARTL